MMRSSSSTAAGALQEVPLIQCPMCPRLDPIMLLTSGKPRSFGEKFVKCESHRHPGPALPKCYFFMWLEDYIIYHENKEYLKGAYMQGAGIRHQIGVVAGYEKGQQRSSLPAISFPGTESSQDKQDAIELVGAELKNLSGNMNRLVELKKQGNLMAGAFYVCVVILDILALLFK